jgi:hypothetical protein
MSDVNTHPCNHADPGIALRFHVGDRRANAFGLFADCLFDFQLLQSRPEYLANRRHGQGGGDPESFGHSRALGNCPCRKIAK